jgi:hypothetical protein
MLARTLTLALEWTAEQHRLTQRRRAATAAAMLEHRSAMPFLSRMRPKVLLESPLTNVPPAHATSHYAMTLRHMGIHSLQLK